jgi:hypothetical protein
VREKIGEKRHKSMALLYFCNARFLPILRRRPAFSHRHGGGTLPYWRVLAGTLLR